VRKLFEFGPITEDGPLLFTVKFCIYLDGELMNCPNLFRKVYGV